MAAPDGEEANENAQQISGGISSGVDNPSLDDLAHRVRLFRQEQNLAADEVRVLQSILARARTALTTAELRHSIALSDYEVAAQAALFPNRS